MRQIPPKFREIKASAITQTVAKLCQQANFELGEDVLDALKQAQQAGNLL